MTDQEAIEHAKALHDFCRDTDCVKCPFIEFEFDEGRIDCKFSDYSEPPCKWELEE